MSTACDADIVTWANDQAALLRARRCSQLDIEHIADEVEDVGKSEQRDLKSHMAVLLAHLLKWRFEHERRGTSWQVAIRSRRKEVLRSLSDTPNLKSNLDDNEWWDIVWGRAVDLANRETGIKDFPVAIPWSRAESLDPDYLPD